ncbi:MAG: division/cell wall cluster transcriptional repressor MraZ, partial [Acidimicrobiales bacterium]
HEVEQPGGPGPRVEAAVVAPARPETPRFFMGSYEHSVDDKNRLVLPATYRGRLADGAYLGPLDAYLGLWPAEGFGAVIQRWEDGIGLGLVSEEAYDAFSAATFEVQPDAQGRIVVPRSLRSFADLDGPVMVVGARQRIAVWARGHWDRRMGSIPEGPDAALRQAARDLRL